MAYDAKPLIRRLELFDAIPEAAKNAMREILQPAVAIEKGEVLRREGGTAGEFWVVTDGWFFDSAAVANGGRQVFTVYQRGDVMGLQDLGWDVAVCDTTAATPGRVIKVQKQDFRDVIGAHPVLSGFFLTYGIYDHTRLIDRLRVVGRMDAVRRVAHFLLQCWADQNEPDPLPEAGRFAFPLDQQLVGDAVGLTNISVSRMMSELHRENLAERQGREIHVPDVARLKAFCEFKERRRAVPLSWVLRKGDGLIETIEEPSETPSQH